ncbi:MULTISPECIES: DUF4426 domain-containing protein [Pseudomonadaceae]|jgi:hypothetical protein|uniref:DUF4426 domain-containing protein n=1 Tax=Aquipseudomonas alcaligenes TaxID=43263 RepID=A0A142IME0_AQUAC|nr:MULTISPECIES: DUF4426 domain-containing protein [Pseudomonas]AMR65472.1 homoserine acetyltransferase [Pseudomonas alcaligenes]MDH1054211.1 DUF4426 domain-containing protein [Pseudomonas alcaligenes]MEE1948113.1 DUF4426 domain-containing protein [Pseudomonas alcaligenes]NMY42070.1 DUF4426 domain-containing protein [Pseudomonas sp. WS 5013]SIQ65272.1 protein of unknown function [Pseudomonas alcaligenes]
MRRFVSLVFCLLLALPAVAERKQTFGELDVHYSVFNSSFLQPDVAAAAGLTRSKTVGVLNIAALKDGKGQAAKVSGTLKNLLGQTSELKFKQVLESGAVYYLAEFPLRQREMLTFSIQVQIGDAAPHTLTFNQEVFPDE